MTGHRPELKRKPNTGEGIIKCYNNITCKRYVCKQLTQQQAPSMQSGWQEEKTLCQNLYIVQNEKHQSNANEASSPEKKEKRPVIKRPQTLIYIMSWRSMP
eukprot:GHVO01068627.1.p1 GENE.GHVO01068627.1~~GHVO01068627.1.p1  ORF type:complete len:101 (-),score=9.75 GHVO01068627.1:190-492(-)